MTANSARSRPRRRGPAGPLVPLLLCLLCLAGLVLLPGCGGCRKTPQQRQAEKEKREAERRERERKEREEKKPDVEMGKLLCLPHEPAGDFGYYKPGHWIATSMSAKANNFHLVGDMEMAVVDRRGSPVRLLGLRHTAVLSRQVALPKGQAKLLPSVLYVPPFDREAFLSSRINARGGMGGSYAKLHGLRRMPPYQYHLVVLARWPENYKYLDGLDSVRHPADLSAGNSGQGFYRVELLRKVPETLPQHALYWTTIACVLWDDPEPTALTLDQQVALLDWLHWGGQLIISGPDSLHLLHNGFLGPYLPATSAGTRELTAADFHELNERWTLPVHGRPGKPLAAVRPWSGVEFAVHALAREVPGTGGLLVERRVGRGRIVVSAFELDEPELLNWPGFDGLFNACLLGRPRRTFGGNEWELWARWTDATPEGPFFPLDARAVSKLRYFTRDTGAKVAVKPAEDEGLYDETLVPMAYGDAGPPANRYDADVGSWSDFNAVAKSARAALQNAARIEIPGRTFVVWVVGVYLLVLVPANWLVFRSVGRVEWAWAAAPVIAIVYTLVVIRLAQLDIGFARSLTEISVVEMQGDYPRAHVTRYTALYTSLATTYEFHFDDPGAQVQPFPSVDDPGRLELSPGQTIGRIRYVHGRDVTMRGFHVRSNFTEMVHSEQMVDLAGAIALEETPGGGSQVTNRTALTLHGAGVIRCNGSGRLETAWIGTLAPGETASLRFVPRVEGDLADRVWAAERAGSPVTAGGTRKGELDLRPLVDLVEDHAGIRTTPQRDRSGPQPDWRDLHPGDLRRLDPGDARLTGWLAEEIAGLHIRPAAPQALRAAMVVAHLRYGFGDDPQPDTNCRLEFATEQYRSVGPEEGETGTP